MGLGRRPIAKFLISVLSAVVLTLSAALAEKHEQPDGPGPIRGYIPIQLPLFSVPVVARDGWLGRGVISMFLVVRGQKNVETFCRYMPRVREAITLTVDQTPIPILKKKYQLKKIGTLLHQAINKTLPKPLVIRLHLLAGGWPMGQGGVNLELPGTDSKCMALKEIPEQVLALLRGEDPEAKTSSVPDPEAKPEPRAISRPKPPKSEVRIVPRLLPSGSVPSRSASAPPKTAKIDIPAWKENAQGQKFQDPKTCRNLSDVWTPGFHQAGGRTYWLSRAYTLDDDNDGVVDNVGFILRAEGRSDLTIYYFPGPGRQSVVTVPTLRLKDDRDVLAICFGQEEFTKFKEKDKTPEKPFKVPDLAAELASKSDKADKADKAEDGLQAAGEPGKKASRNPFSGGMGLVFAIAAGVGVLLILGAGAGYVVARRRSERRRKERRGRPDRRRGRDRREREKPPEGDDRRKAGDRRGDAKRRTEEDRRD